MESSDQWKRRDREVQMETENTDLYERSERMQWWNKRRDGRQDGERERERRKGKKKRGGIICDSVLLKPLAVY